MVSARHKDCSLDRVEDGTIDTIKTGIHYDRLKKRRDEIMMTLRHLEKEQRGVEDNKDWVDRAAFESRVGLLDRLSEWYVKEMGQIDQALVRVAENKYGLCLACHEAIEPRRLDPNPEAAFCAACQGMREEVARV
jgi:RNA polymerase-binding transcription factor DksA